MEEYIADDEGRIDVPGVQATYPPGTHVFYENGQYAGHESPILEPPEKAKTDETCTTSRT
jgi:hypothetical protein